MLVLEEDIKLCEMGMRKSQKLMQAGYVNEMVVRHIHFTMEQPRCAMQAKSEHGSDDLSQV